MLLIQFFLMKFYVHILKLQGPLRKFQVHIYLNSVVADIFSKAVTLKLLHKWILSLPEAREKTN